MSRFAPFTLRMNDCVSVSVPVFLIDITFIIRVFPLRCAIAFSR